MGPSDLPVVRKAMREKTERLENLLLAGWRVEDIASDAHEIEVTLVRGRERETLHLEPSDAAELLGLA